MSYLDLEAEETHHIKRRISQENDAPKKAMPRADLQRAVANPRAASPDALRELSHVYGNKAVQRLVQRTKGSAFGTPAPKVVIQRTIEQHLSGDDKNILPKSSLPNDFHATIINPFWLRVYCAWLTDTHRDESARFLKAVMEFKSNPTFGKAREIYATHVDPNGPDPINSPSNLIDPLRQMFGGGVRTLGGQRGTVPANTFDAIINEMHQSMFLAIHGQFMSAVTASKARIRNAKRAEGEVKNEQAKQNNKKNQVKGALKEAFPFFS